MAWRFSEMKPVEIWKDVIYHTNLNTGEQTIKKPRKPTVKELQERARRFEMHAEYWEKQYEAQIDGQILLSLRTISLPWPLRGWKLVRSERLQPTEHSGKVLCI